MCMGRRSKGPDAVDDRGMLDEQVIGITPNFPFYERYHDERYVTSHDRRSVVTLKDKGESRVYSLINDSNKELVVYQIDSGLIDDKKVSKCDFGIYSEDNLLVLVELKGSDYSAAIEQLLSTIEILLKTPKVSVTRLFTRVVLSKARVLDILLTKEKKLKLLVEREYHGSHSKCSRVMKDTLSKI